MPSIVSKLYAMGNLMKLGSTVERLENLVEEIVERELTERIEGPPPEANVRHWYELFDFLFNLHAPHHERKVSSRAPDGNSMLVHDLHELLSLYNHDPNSGVWSHYCWDAGARRPCCSDLAETKYKMKSAFMNVLVTPTFPLVTMSRFTYVLKAAGKVLTSFALRRVFPQGVWCKSGCRSHRGRVAGRRC